MTNQYLRSICGWRYLVALAQLGLAGVLASCGGGGESSSTSEFVPRRITCVDSQSQDAMLAWDPVAGATGYHIYYGTSFDAWRGMNEITGDSNTTTTVTGLNSGETYYFVASAYDDKRIDGYRSDPVCLNIP